MYTIMRTFTSSCPTRFNNPVATQVRIASYRLFPLVVFAGAMLLTGCQQQAEGPTLVEATLEAQAIQMAAINDRLAHAEHHWHANIEALHRQTQMTDYNLNGFREEQVRFRDVLVELEEDWSEKDRRLRNRQGQIQQAVRDLDKTLATSDGRALNEAKILHSTLQINHASLTSNLTSLSRNDSNLSRQISALQQTTGNVLEEVDDVSDDLKTVKANQRRIKAIAKETANVSTTAVRHIQQVEKNQGQLLDWTDTQDEQQQLQAARDTKRHASLAKDIAAVDNHVKQQGARVRKLAAENGERHTALTKDLAAVDRRLQTHAARREALAAESRQRHETLTKDIAAVDSHLTQQTAELTEQHRKLAQKTKTSADLVTSADDTEMREIKTALSHQGEAIDAQTQMLGRVHKDITAQLEGMDTKQRTLQEKLTQDRKKQSATAAQLRQSVKAQLTELVESLAAIERQIQDTTVRWDANAESHSAAAVDTAQALKQLQQTIKETSGLQRKLRDQLARLDKRVRQNHREQSDDLADIREHLPAKPQPSEATPEPNISK